MPVREILPDFFFIQRGYLNANHFVYRGPEPVLIDTGYISGFAETESLIAGVGVDLSRVRLIVGTHAHCDHIGGNHRIQARSGCDIALHRIGKHFIDTRDDWATWWRYYGQEAEFFEATIALDDGDRIAAGPYEFEVLHTPGHAADGIALYDRAHRLLISSDALWEKDAGTINPRVEGSRAPFDQIETLDRLAGLEVEIVFPGHGAPFTDFRAALARVRGRMLYYLAHPDKFARSRIKKVMTNTLLITGPVSETALFERLMAHPCFPEVVDYYFDGRYDSRFREALAEMLRDGLVERLAGGVASTLQP